MQKNRIIIIDRQTEERENLVHLFSDEYEVYATDENGNLTFNKEDISLIFCDADILLGDNCLIINMLKRDGFILSIPIIATAEVADDETKTACFKAGVYDYIVRPSQALGITDKIKNIINVRYNYNLIHETKFDRLTGVYNKGYFYEVVSEIFERCKGDEFDIVCCDIANFKMINEKYNSDIGDEVLKSLANVKLFEDDYVLGGRISSNTFATITKHRESYDRDVFERFIDNVVKDIPINNITIKFGIYNVTDTTIPVSSMCDRAVMAMDRIKHKYDVLFAYYDDAMIEELFKEQKISDIMEDALSNGEFSVYLQPKHDLVTGKVSGAEALVRWNSSQYGFMMPGDFIPVFEKNGFITNIDMFVWDKTCQTIRGWIDEGFVPVPVSVNISRLDFEKLELVEHFSDLVDKYNIPTSYLHLEVTETVYTDNPEQLIQTVEQLRTLGFKIEMDDFGSGYSSLNMLSDLPIDILKLDMKFMRHHKNPENNRRIVSFILSLSKWLGLATIAEGVETESDANLLASMGCNYVQGFLYAKPMPIKEFERYVKNCESSYKKQDFTLEPDNVFSIEKRDMPVKLLVVEDVKFNRDLLCSMLGSYYEIATADNGQEALEYIEREYQNGSNATFVILLDIMMPVMDGFQLINILKASEEYKNIPVIITSEAGHDSELKAIQLGAMDFIAKPYRKEVIIHRIEQAIDECELMKYKNK